MTKSQLRRRIRELMLNQQMNMEVLIEKAINSGAFDIDKYEDDFLLARIILTAVHSDMADLNEPIDEESREEVRNLKLFI